MAWVLNQTRAGLGAAGGRGRAARGRRPWCRRDAGPDAHHRRRQRPRRSRRCAAVGRASSASSPTRSSAGAASSPWRSVIAARRRPLWLLPAAWGVGALQAFQLRVQTVGGLGLPIELLRALPVPRHPRRAGVRSRQRSIAAGGRRPGCDSTRMTARDRPIDEAWHPVAWANEVDARRPARPHAPRSTARRCSAAATARRRRSPDRCPHRGTALSLGSVVERRARPARTTAGSSSRTAAAARIPSLGDSTPIPEGAHARAAGVRRARRPGVGVARRERRRRRPSRRSRRPASIGGDRLLTGAPLVWRTSAGRHVENILDLAHFPFVHPGTFGCPEARDRRCPRRHRRRRVARLRGRRHHPQPRQPTAPPVSRPRADDPPRVPLPRRPAVPHDARVRVPGRHAPRPPRGRRTERTRPLHRSTGRCSSTSDSTSDDEDELAFARAVFAEDQPIIESQPPGVPVDRRAEIHVPADRLAVAYRRALRDWGVPEGSVV